MAREEERAERTVGMTAWVTVAIPAVASVAAVEVVASVEEEMAADQEVRARLQHSSACQRSREHLAHIPMVRQRIHACSRRHRFRKSAGMHLGRLGRGLTRSLPSSRQTD